MVAAQEKAYLATEIFRFHNEIISRVLTPEALRDNIKALRAKIPEGESSKANFQSNSRHTKIEVTIRDTESVVTTETALGLTRVRTSVYQSVVDTKEGRRDVVDWQREPLI